MSAARPAYGVDDAAPSRERAPSGALPLLMLFVGLAAATVWFVALPAFDESPAKPSCEVYVLESGSPACKPLTASRVTSTKPKPASAKR